MLFAEATYRDYITPYTRQMPQHSPRKGWQGLDEPYYRAYEAIKDLSDPTLQALRQSFGGFSRAFDATRILEIAANELSRPQAEVLAEPFDYRYGQRGG